MLMFFLSSLASVQKDYAPRQAQARKVCGTAKLYTDLVLGSQLSSSLFLQHHDCDNAWASMDPAPGWEIVSGGSTARVEREFRSTQVVKSQYPDCFDPDLTRYELQREFDVYQVLPKHPRLLQLCPGSTPERLILPYLPNGTLQDRLNDLAAPLDDEQRLLLTADAAEAVAVLHESNVVHCDLQPQNFMLTDEHRLCLIDFAGSTLLDDRGTALESLRYFLPRPIEEPSTVRTDLFALGSVLYAIFSGRAPYADEPDEEVVRLFAAGQFPSTNELLCGNEIRGCWTGSFSSAKEVFEDLVTCFTC